MWHRVSYIETKVVPRPPGPASPARSPPAVADMEPVASNIQVLLQAAEFLERRERGEDRPRARGQDLAPNLDRARLEGSWRAAARTSTGVRGRQSRE